MPSALCDRVPARSPRRLAGLALSLGLGLLAACGGIVDDDEGGQAAGNVVGGKSEPTAYPSVGYLKSRASAKHLLCGATLIAPTVAITAGHCVTDELHRLDSSLQIGFGAFGSGAEIAIKRVFMHPQCSALDALAALRPSDVDWDDTETRNDLAVLLLASPAPVAPAFPFLPSVPVKAGDTLRLIGYGQTDPDDPYSIEERNSTQVKVTEVLESELLTKGVDGSGCNGDSGTGLFIEGTRSLVGVHSRGTRANGTYCGVDARKIVTSTLGQRTFIEAATKCQHATKMVCTPEIESTCTLQPNLDCGTELDAACVFRCEDYGAKPGETRLDWKCDDDGCLRKFGAP